MKKKYIKWKIIFEVTFYGNDTIRGSFRDIKKNSLLFDDRKFKKKHMVTFDNKENVEINFLIWVDGIEIKNLVTLPSDYYDENVRYDEESIEVLDIIKLQ